MGSITDLTTSWEGYSKGDVEDFLKDKIRAMIAELQGKFGDATYEGGQLKFYDESGGTLVGALTITGTSYIVSVDSNVPSSFTVLTSDASYMLRLTPTTQSMEFGSTTKEDYPEDYTFKFEVDSGSGFVDRTPIQNTIKQGAFTEIDIRNYLTTGVNRIRVVVTGAESGQPRTLVFTALLTSLSLSCNHKWHTVWFEGETYAITNIFFSGNIAKTLYVKVGDDDPLTITFAASTQYVSVPTTFDLTNATPSESGVIPIEIWMAGEGVETKHITYNVMYVAKVDIGNISLICTNDVPSKVYNFSQGTLLKYAVYNVGSINASVIAHYDGNDVTLYSSDIDVVAQTKYDLDLNLQIDTMLNDGISLEVVLSSDGATATETISVDNSNAYIPTVGAKFYLNTSLGSNTTAERTYVINSAVLDDIDLRNYKNLYPAVWDGFTFSDDAWSMDADGNRALAVKAGSQVTIPDLKPLFRSNNNSASFEFMFRASNIADYDTPIISCMDTEDYESATTGLVVFPTKIVLLSASNKNVVFQQLPLSEDRIHHITVVVQRTYAGDATKNLARIFINGCENVTFSFEATDVFYNTSGINSLRLGQASTDTYLYMARIYDKALEGTEVFANYLNALIETAETSRLGLRDDNNILEAGVPNYYLCKKAGFNAFIIETDKELPSLDSQAEYKQVEVGEGVYETGINLHLEYNDHPEWNVSAYDIPLDGQGTTSKLYKIWNLRWNIKQPVLWRYHNLKDEKGNVLEEKSKAGYIMGYGLNAPVSKGTWKKNYASQPQGHKMGATALYNDLYKKVMGGAEYLVTNNILPTQQSRVSTLQMPFVGWQKRSDGSYTFLGMFTGGADKTDKNTFGYNEVGKFPSLMMIEGPNHDPYMTRFIVPWVDVFFDYANETLSVGAASAADGNKQEGWDADIVADYSTDKASDASAILALYESEFKPAYDATYYNSPYLASLSEVGYTSVAAINNDLTNFRKGETTLSYQEGANNEQTVTYTVSNSLLTMYDSNYNLIYYRIKTGKYELLPNDIHDMLAYLGLSGTPTTNELITARRKKFIVEIAKYVNMGEAYFRQDFDEFLGVSDNDAKNSYWRKFLALSLGGKWGFNKDDLDTLFQNDNNGQDTKDYFVEPNDVINGSEIFQGRTSAFWFAIRLWCKDGLRNTMKEIANQFRVLAQELNVKGTTLKDQVMGVISYYFWEHSSKYFPATIYNADTTNNYINVWFENPTAVYNNVPPLTQIHGDHYETEREWVEKRIAYMFSKYQLGAFEAGAADGYGSLEFTPAEEFEMEVTPAIWLYPRLSVGSAETSASERTQAGDVHTLILPASGTTGVYIKGVDWLSDLGDLSKLKLASRGGSDVISFTIDGKRLRRVKVGSADGNVTFNAALLAVNGESIEEVDAQNATTVQGTLNLQGCPRLRRAYLNGTSLQHIYPPVGGRVRELVLPESTATLFLHSLNLLEADKLTIPNLANISSMYVNNCDHLDPLEMLKAIYNTDGNKLDMIGIVWAGIKEDDDKNTMIMLGDIARQVGVDGGYRGAIYENGAVVPQTVPNISGTLKINYSVYERDIEAIEKSRIPITLLYDASKLYVWFEDDVVREIVATKWGDGVGITEAQVKEVTKLGGVFRGNSTIETFNELEKFTGLTQISPLYDSGYGSSDFYNCVSLREVKVPSSVTRIGSYAFTGCTSLKTVDFVDKYSITDINTSAFSGCSELEMDIDFPNLTTMTGSTVFNGCKKIKRITSLGNIDTINGAPNVGHSSSMFYGCSSLETATLPDNLIKIGLLAFKNCTSLSSCNFPKSLNTIEGSAFYNCTSLEIDDLALPNLETLGQDAFYGIKIKKISNLGKLTAIPSGSSTTQNFGDKTTLEEINIPPTVTSLSKYCFGDYSNLKKVDGLEGVTTVDGYVFQKAKNISYLHFPSIVTFGKTYSYIGVFSHSENLNLTLRLGSSCSTIAGLMFSYSKNCIVTLICEAATPPELGGNIFHSASTSSFEAIYVPDASVEAYKTATNWSTYADRIFPLSDYDGGGVIDFYDPDVEAICVSNWDTSGSGYLSVDEAKAVTSIGTVFSGNTEITSFNELNKFTKVTSLVAKAFFGCVNLEEVGLENITTINGHDGGGAFMNSGIKIANFNKLSKINNSYSCEFQGSAIEQLILGGTLESIPSGNGSYYGFAKNVKSLQSVVFPDTLKVIGGYAFSGCTSLNSINLPPSIETIGEEAFFGCNALSIDNIILPKLKTLSNNSFRNTDIKRILDLGVVTTMGITGGNDMYNGVFSYNKNLSLAILPETLTMLGVGTFYQCSSLSTLVIKAITPPTLYGGALTSTSSSLRIYVPDPDGTGVIVQSYKNATNWSSYASSIFPISQLDTDNHELYAEIEEYL